MKTETIKDALQSAYSLLNDEVGAIEYEDLKDDYLLVIEKLEIAIKEIDKNE